MARNRESAPQPKRGFEELESENPELVLELVKTYEAFMGSLKKANEQGYELKASDVQRYQQENMLDTNEDGSIDMQGYLDKNKPGNDEA